MRSVSSSAPRRVWLVRHAAEVANVLAVGLSMWSAGTVIENGGSGKRATAVLSPRMREKLPSKNAVVCLVRSYSAFANMVAALDGRNEHLEVAVAEPAKALRSGRARHRDHARTWARERATAGSGIVVAPTRNVPG